MKTAPSPARFPETKAQISYKGRLWSVPKAIQGTQPGYSPNFSPGKIRHLFRRQQGRTNRPQRDINVSTMSPNTCQPCPRSVHFAGMTTEGWGQAEPFPGFVIEQAARHSFAAPSMFFNGLRPLFDSNRDLLRHHRRIVGNVAPVGQDKLQGVGAGRQVDACLRSDHRRNDDAGHRPGIGLVERLALQGGVRSKD